MKPTTKRSGAELRQAAAVREAVRREASFLGNLAGAQDDYEWIVEREAWTDLGHETFADWWQARVQPTMRALSMRPTRALADKVVQRVRADEAELPPAQRRTQQQLADLAGVHPDTISGRKRQDPQQAEVPPTDDLDGPEPTVDQDSAEPAPEFVPSPNGPVPAGFAATLDRFAPDPNPHAEWRLGFLKRVHAVHAVMRSKPEDVAEMADERCLDELIRCADAFTDYRLAVVRARALPDNVTQLRRVQ
jgi:hypothetical protein